MSTPPAHGGATPDGTGPSSTGPDGTEPTPDPRADTGTGRTEHAPGPATVAGQGPGVAPNPVPPQRRSPLVPLLLAIIAALVALVIALLPGLGADDDQAPAPAAGPTAPTGNGTADPHQEQTYAELAKLARRKEGDPLALGRVDAPVVLIEYSDFSCTYCLRFAYQTFPQLKRYVADGTLRIEWRDFPYLSDGSLVAARAARAAAQQGKFWQFHDALFDARARQPKGALDDARMTRLAAQVGLDQKRFAADRTSKAVYDAVGADFTQGQRIGVTGTPSFLVNGRPIVGAQDLAVFEQAIRDAAGTKS